MNFNKAYVYILSNKHRNVLYIGVTNDLERRIAEHKNGVGSVFTKKYTAHELLYYEIHSNIKQAIAREKQLKEWKKDWKIDLIKTMNFEMNNLAHDWEYDLDVRSTD
ncbi:MAG: GIY-YIG nuclease family protein [Bacteroidetes bacterium]|nr:GIY-YIG nuclease family protein [Bacteroidota bacterium]